MKKQKQFTLKTWYMIGCLLVAALPILILTSYYYQNSIKSIRNSYIESRTRAVEQISDSIQKRADWVGAVISQLYLDNDLTALLKKPEVQANKNDLKYREVLSSLSQLYVATPIFNYINTIMIQGDNGLDIRYGERAALLSIDNIVSSQWYQSGKATHSIVWGAYGKHFYEYSKDTYAIPVYFSLPDNISADFLGNGILLLNPGFFTNTYDKLASYKDEHIYILKQEGDILATNQTAEDGTLLEITPQIRDILDKVLIESNKISPNTEVNHYITEINRLPWLVTYRLDPIKKWLTIEILPMTESAIQARNLAYTIVAVVAGVAFICVLLSNYLSNALTKPIKVMVKYVADIGKGQFYDMEVPRSANELNILMISINKMQNSISSLLEENVEKEKEKGRIEMQMLQSQINPHFLYNTLNSIKLMAAMQGSSGIERMIDSLGSILRYSLKSSDDKSLLKDEIKVIDDYIHIQNIRYKGRIEYRKEIQDSKLLDCMIPRFIIQPIMENSINHGLLYSSVVGQIILRVYQQDNQLCMEIEDNGKGIDEQQLTELHEKLNHVMEKNGSSNGGIGIYNVHRRIQIMYGREYGLHYESVQNQYTKVTILLKMEE